METNVVEAQQPQLQQFYHSKTIVNDLATEEVYIFDIRGSADGTQVACSASNNLIKLYDVATYKLVSQLAGHQGTITDIQYATASPHLIITCSSDTTAAVWDLRTSTKVAQYIPSKRKELYSLSLSHDDKLLALGSEDYLVLWDVTGNKQMTVYEDSHTNEISQVRFHPTVHNRLYSGGLDGLMCAFEYVDGKYSEDDALLNVYNVEQPVNKIGFFGPSNEFLYGVTSTEMLSFWNLTDDNKIIEFGFDLRDKLSELIGVPVQYLIDCKYNANTQELYLVAGNHDGRLMVFAWKDNAFVPVAITEDNTNGHVSTIRSFLWNVNVRSYPNLKLFTDAKFKNNVLLTAGEDSRLCFWSTQPSEQNETSAIKGSRVLQAKKDDNSIRHKPY